MPLSAEATEIVRTFFDQQIPFNAYLGIRLVELGEGTARVELPYRAELVGDPHRPALHGGVLSATLDAAGGAAGFSLIDLPGDRLSTIDLRVDYLRPADLEPLVAEAAVTRMGNRVCSVDVRCFHPTAPDRLIATGKAVYNVKRASD